MKTTVLFARITCLKYL